MRLLLYKYYDDKNFIDYLIKTIQKMVLSKCDNKHLSKWKKYLSENALFTSKLKTKISVRDIIVSGVYNLKYRNLGSYGFLEIDPNIKIVNTYYTVSSVCKLINDGNLQVDGVKSFTDTFKYTSDNLEDIHQSYLTHPFIG